MRSGNRFRCRNGACLDDWFRPCRIFCRNCPARMILRCVFRVDRVDFTMPRGHVAGFKTGSGGGGAFALVGRSINRDDASRWAAIRTGISRKLRRETGREGPARHACRCVRPNGWSSRRHRASRRRKRRSDTSLRSMFSGQTRFENTRRGVNRRWLFGSVITAFYGSGVARRRDLHRDRGAIDRGFRTASGACGD